MNYSPNIELLKPEQNEQFDISHFNENADKIDAHIHALEESSDTLGVEINRVYAETRQFENMQGVCKIEQGGTGKTTAQEALDELHKDVQITDNVRDVDEILLMQSGSGAGTVKKILVEDLAAKVFGLIRESSGIFTPEKNGFAPKSGGHGTSDFLRADGTWGVPQGAGTGSVDVSSSSTFGIDNDMVFRIKADTTTVVSDPSKLMVKATFINETPKAQKVRLRQKAGNTVYRLNKGKTWQVVWNGSFWIPLYEEVAPGTVMVTFANTAPDGWFLCVGTDTTGTGEQLSTCYPNLYDILGSNVIPDLRECGFVGAGRNARYTMVSHDVYEVGQFKDDVVRNHTHSLANHTHAFSGTTSTAELKGHTSWVQSDYRYSGGGTDGIVSLSGAERGDVDGLSGHAVCVRNFINATHSHTVSGTTTGPSNNTSGAVNGSGAGGSTHGKQVGINYMIKA